MPNSKAYKPLTVSVGGVKAEPGQYTVLSFSRSTGGRRVDSATVAVERAPDLFLQNASARPVEINKTLEVFYGNTRVFWGVVEDASFSWGDRPDDKTIIASIQPWLFGPPIARAVYIVVEKRNYLGNAERIIGVDEPIVFNGFAAGREEWTTREGKSFVGNKTVGDKYLGLKRDGTRTAGRTALLIPLESVQTNTGRTRYANTFSPWARLDESAETPKRKGASFEWTLRDAIRYVCVHGNDESHIGNPSEAEYSKLPELILPRTELPVGRYLPDYLDELLKPYGYDWFIEPDTAGKPQIVFLQWGFGVEVDAKFAKVGAVADFDTTNVANIDATYSVSQAINSIHVKGGRILVEGTFKLYRVGVDKWVWNEGADYESGDYPTYKQPNTLEAQMGDTEVPVPDMSAILTEELLGEFAGSGAAKNVQRRRRFLPTITTGPADIDAAIIETRPIGPNGGYDLEYLDFDGATWQNVNTLENPLFRHFRVLEDECGIVFDRGSNEDATTPGEFPDNEFIHSSADIPRLRITATIEMDFCVQSVVKRDLKRGVFSVAEAEHSHVWWNPQRWPCRLRIASGRYATKYAAAAFANATPSPDQLVADMKREARAMLGRLDAARVNGAIVFNSLDNRVPLGGVVTKIAGREFSMLSRHSKDTPQYPQVVAVAWEPQEAVIIATLTTETANALESFG